MWANVTAAMAEPNLEKRSVLAMQLADESLSAAKKAYEEQKADEFRKQLAAVQDLVALTQKSLTDTGKRARRSPKYFKRAEKALLPLIRRLSSFAVEVSVDDRPLVQSVKQNASDVLDQIVTAVLTEK